MRPNEERLFKKYCRVLNYDGPGADARLGRLWQQQAFDARRRELASRLNVMRVLSGFSRC